MDTVTFEVVPAGEAAFFQLYAAVRTEELRMQDWDPDLRDRLLKLQFEAQRRGYRERWPNADERFILRDGWPIGWIIVDGTGSQLHGIDMALLREERRKGVGTRVIRALQQEAGDNGRPVVITVQRLNIPALALYLRLGFVVTTETDLHTVMEWRR